MDGEGREFLSIKIQIPGISAERFSVNSDNVDSTPVLLRNRLEVGGKLLPLLLRFRKDKRQRNSGLY